MNRIFQRALTRCFGRTNESESRHEKPEVRNVNDYYVVKSPSQQNVLDLFSGEWSSAMPEGSGLATSPGQVGLFDDARVHWAEKFFGGFTAMDILELGPLEGAHSYMFSRRGARNILAIEANSRAFLKCLCIKEIFRLSNVEFTLGDFNKYLVSCSRRFDLVFASGVLYHMADPIEFLESVARVSDRLFIWTHYYDEKIISGNRNLSHKFAPLKSMVRNGFSYQCSTQEYKESLQWAGFCGGPGVTSEWLTRDSILDFLNVSGFKNVQIEFDQPQHPNGPAFAICVQRLT